MSRLAHIMILASAGSGKTYALTNRFVELLAHGARPDRIVALTFTRKAAGEFFDEILKKLARAARDPAAAQKLAGEIGAAQLGIMDFRRMLREVADAMHRLRLGTLDSFFGRIARVFPFELGLEGDFEVLEEHSARLERQRVLRRMFTHAGEPDAAQREFIESFKRATFGAEEKQLAPRLDAFLDAHQERYLEVPLAEYWGDPARIWPEPNPWLEPTTDGVTAARIVTEWIETASISEKHRERWKVFLRALETWTPGSRVGRNLGYVLDKAITEWPSLLARDSKIEFDRKRQNLSGAACGALVVLTRHVIRGELLRHLETTRGIHAVLRGYDTVYHDVVRRAGKLTFGDVQRLLLPEGARGTLTRRNADNGRLFVDYRLDAEIDHWLLDEFQDTSFGQWRVLSNLIDEVVQDGSGTRSFFCVGDVKQAIFTWREGDPRLFREIFRHYNSARPGVIVGRQLIESWRSGPPVIKMVNTVFGNASAITRLFPGPAAESWNAEWRDHVSALPDRSGQCALLLARDEGERWRRMIEILHEIRPLERGLTCAVLVPKNSTATQLADFLRREGGLPAVADSDLHVCTDNPLGAALLALFQVAAHPGDGMAWEHVQMTPLGGVLAAEEISTREAATLRILDQVHQAGFEATIEFWLRRLEATLSENDAFSRMRARQFVAAAARYEDDGRRDIAEFVQFMERYVVRDVEVHGVLRVMTIHKSKGLGFDVVILPDVEGNRIDQRREGLAVQKGPDRAIQWILDLPPKSVYAADEVLARHVRAAEADACYEALSLLYVAMTRAKRALYVLMESTDDSVSRNYAKLLTETLGSERRTVKIGRLVFPALWDSGDHDWPATISPAARETNPPRQLTPLDGVSRTPRRVMRRPSGHNRGWGHAGRLFSIDGDDSVEFGAEVHALLADVKWRHDGIVARWRAAGRNPAVVAEAEACLTAASLADVWTDRSQAEVWCERSFEVVLDEAWVTGVFDRVIVERGANGRAEWVTVYDFKTDRLDESVALDDAVRRHSPQLNIYRRVAAILAGVPVDAVTCELVFTRIRQRVRVSAE